jgi:small-conductance mechanosensitive channel
MLRARLKTQLLSCSMVTGYVLIFKTVFPVTLSIYFIFRVIIVIFVQNHHFLSSLTYSFAGLTAVASDYITSLLTLRVPVAWMYTKELHHVARRAVLELITTYTRWQFCSHIRPHARHFAGATNFLHKRDVTGLLSNAHADWTSQHCCS